VCDINLIKGDSNEIYRHNDSIAKIRDRSDKIADSILENDPHYVQLFSRKIKFWIISHAPDSIYGPLSLEEYLEKRTELGVPDDLRLELEL